MAAASCAAADAGPGAGESAAPSRRLSKKRKRCTSACRRSSSLQSWSSGRAQLGGDRCAAGTPDSAATWQGGSFRFPSTCAAEIRRRRPQQSLSPKTLLPSPLLPPQTLLLQQLLPHGMHRASSHWTPACASCALLAVPAPVSDLLPSLLSLSASESLSAPLALLLLLPPPPLLLPLLLLAARHDRVCSDLGSECKLGRRRAGRRPPNANARGRLCPGPRPNRRRGMRCMSAGAVCSGGAAGAATASPSPPASRLQPPSGDDVCRPGAAPAVAGRRQPGAGGCCGVERGKGAASARGCGCALSCELQKVFHSPRSRPNSLHGAKHENQLSFTRRNGRSPSEPP